MEKYFTTYQVAQLCHVSRGSVIRWIDEGKLQSAITAGGHHRVPEGELTQFLKTLRMPTPSDLLTEGDKRHTIKILVVDDEEPVRRLFRSFFERYYSHFEVAEAGDGFQAGLMVSGLRPDLVLLDLLLPGVDGFQVCRNIRNLSELNHTRVIAISGMLDEKLPEKILRCGADDFLSKPIHLGTLKEKIGKYLQIFPDCGKEDGKEAA